MVALIAICGMFSTAAASTLIAEIPYRHDYEGWITVPVFVNGQGPYDFIVDSGATLTVTFENLARQQDFPFVEGDLKRILGLLEINSLPPQFIGNLTIGGQTLPNLTSVVVPDWLPPRQTPQGVLGLDFLSQYVVEIDPSAGLMRLYKGGPIEKVRVRGWRRAKMEETFFAAFSKPLYTVEIKIGSEQYPFILDLGASGTLMNYAMAKDTLKVRGINSGVSARRTRLPEVQDLFGNEETSRLIRIRRMKLGGRTWRNEIITVFNARVFDELGVNDMPYGLLGADLLRDSPLVLDFPRERIYIKSPAK